MESTLLKRVISAHGGLDRWNQVESIQLSLDIFGPILITRFKSPWLSNISACVFTEKPYVSFHHFPEEGMTSIFDGYSVYIFDQNDRIISERNFRNDNSLKTKPRLLWDHLDLVYFLGYALWNYICCPFMLSGNQFECIEGDDWLDKDGSRMASLHVRYPDSIPTHCRDQVFYFNQNGLLQRNDYTCEFVSPVSVGAHYCDEHKTIGGLVFPTRRRVFPRLWNGRVLRPLKVMDGHIRNIMIQWKSVMSV